MKSQVLSGQPDRPQMDTLTKSKPLRVPPASLAPTSNPIGVPPVTPIP